MTGGDENIRMAVIGLGYVGLPLAVAFAEHFPVIGYDVNSQRVDQLNNHQDNTQEVSPEALSLIHI